MKKLRRPGLLVEQLEARDCPALSIFYNASSLTVRGLPNGMLNITGKAGNVFQVTDNGANLGSYALTGDLRVFIVNRRSELNVDLKGQAVLGSLTLDLGNGYVGTQKNNTVDVFSTAAGGAVRGNVLLQRGNGSETYNLGAFDTDGPAPNTTSAPLNILGNIFATGRNPGGAQSGNSLSLFGGSNVGGSVTTSLIPLVSIGSQAVNGGIALSTVGSNVTATNSNSSIRLALSVNGNVGGNVTGIGTNLADSFTLGVQGAGVGGNVGGNVTFAAGNSPAGKNFNLNPGTLIGGSATFIDGNNGGTPGVNGDNIVLDGNVNGSVNLNVGNGVENVEFVQTATGGNIAGNLNVTAGNGSNFLGNVPFAPPGMFFPLNPQWTGTVGGSANLNLGNGTNVVAIDGDTGALPPPATGGFSVGSGLNIRMGNGSNTVTIKDNTPGTTNVIPLNVTFGHGTNTFVIGAPGDPATSGNLTGTINFNNGTDTFTDNKYVFTNTINILNL